MELNFSPLAILSTYYPIQQILQPNQKIQSHRLYVQLSHCVFLLLKHSITYISDILQNYQEKSKELIQVRNSINPLEKILDSFSVFPFSYFIEKK